ncbi:hypothetical protein Dsin_028267 [Dipteronia sinensis]|uniref:Endonuclease/exonuclease/phosphatase domain-containing protein n=1 Tax=Dipteronia sinensis TaxID=43782 RepID=A0AAD9ZRW7_9ROSI|nr:hypothetical protein Dsin_028267 [Dipteronia sinensis]
MDSELLESLCASLSISDCDGPVKVLDGKLMDEVVHRMSLCMVGKVLSNKRVNRDAFRHVIGKIWQVKQGLDIESVTGSKWRPNKEKAETVAVPDPKNVEGMASICSDGGGDSEMCDLRTIGNSEIVSRPHSLKQELLGNGPEEYGSTYKPTAPIQQTVGLGLPAVSHSKAEVRCGKRKVELTNQVDVASGLKKARPSGGCHEAIEEISGERSHSWNLLRRLVDMSNLPWVCVGDFNEVLDRAEKVGGVPKDWKLLAGFREALDDCGLDDLGYTGPQFTLCNKREGETFIQERLDRCVGNLDWQTAFPDFQVSHLDYWCSDHRPVILEFSDNLRATGKASRKRCFHFEECWIDNVEVQDLVSQIWVDRRGLNAVNVVLGNIQDCGARLDHWNQQWRHRLKKDIKEK